MFDWKKYLELARALNTTSVGYEARKRTVVSRAYYGIFNLALQYARAQKWPILKDGNGHKSLSEEFRKQQDDSCKRVGALLSQMRNNRNKCDYADVVSGLDKSVSSTIADAEEAEKIIDTLRK